MADWIATNWGAVYGIGVLIFWALSAAALFFGVWWFAADRYQFPGLLLGWVPGAVAAMTAALIIGLLWPALLIGAIWWWFAR